MSWPQVEFGSICKLQNGRAFKPAEWRDEGVPIIRIQNLNDETKPFNYCDSEIEEKYHVKNGDLLFSWSGTPGTSFGAFFWNRGHSYLNQHIFLVNLDESTVFKNYLRYALNSQLQVIIGQSHGGVGLQHITKVKLEKIEIPLPPLETQKKIAAVLEKADQLRKDCQQMEQALNSLAQSVFIDMFGDPVSNPKGWDTFKLSSISSIQLGKMLSDKSKLGINPKKYLRNANIQWRKVETHDLLFMDFNEKEIKKFQLKSGDLLVCEGGEIGRCAIWQEQVEDCYYQKALHRVRLNHKLATPEYIQEYLFWMAKRGGLISLTNEVTFKHLTAEKLSQLLVPLPPLSMQQKFTKLYSKVRYELEVNAQLMIETDSSFNALMQKAFKGELNLDKSAA